MTSFRAESVTAGYGRHPVLRGVDLPAMDDGQMLGLLGPNASGKSTLIRCLSGELRGAGRVFLNGTEQAAYDRSGWHALVATMPQAPPAATALLPTELLWSTVRALSGGLSDRALAQRIEEVFDELGLDEVALTPLNALSGGKRQLVGLALALIRDPELLLLDEPTSALDLHWRLVVLETVRARLARRGGVAVAALHDLDLAARYCERIVLLDRGRAVAAGSPSEVLTPERLAEVYRVEADVVWDAAGGPSVRVLRPIGRDGHGSPGHDRPAPPA